MGSDWYLGFADEGEEPEVRRQPVWSAPENEVPVPLPISATIGQAEGLVIFVDGFRAYSLGVAFTVSMRRRQAPTGPDIADVFMGHHHGFAAPADRLLIGMEFADGTRVAGGRFGVAESGPLLLDGGGGGGGRSYDKTMWLHPLPPAGPLTVICTWLRLGVAETRTVLDGAVLAEAGAHAEVLWPWEPEPDEPVEEATDAAPLPGWFGETSG